MNPARVQSRAQRGLDTVPVVVEVYVSGGLPSFSLVGLPETVVKESRDRVRAALNNAGFEFPQRRITVNLAPADLPKEGGRFDLPLALALLCATGQVPPERLAGAEFFGELSLSGELRPVPGLLATALGAAGACRHFVVPAASASETALVPGVEVFAAAHLAEVCGFLAGEVELPRVAPPQIGAREEPLEIADVRGQAQAKRALLIAAAGGHNLLLVGPPGTGKSLLAARLVGLLPQLEEAEALEVAALASLSRARFDPGTWRRPPLRMPHHTTTRAALIGGGGVPRPGEVSLAHHGVLFLDELPEFGRPSLEALREPLETGEVRITRARGQVTFPARCQLVAAMNPCPCGYLGDRLGRCGCTGEQVNRYRQRLSGPIADRLDLQVVMPPVSSAELLAADSAGESGDDLRCRVVAARRRQRERAGCLNARLSAAETERWCRPDKAGTRLIEKAMDRLGLSARGAHRVMRVSRSIADLAAAEEIGAMAVSEALGLRRLELADRLG